MSNDLPLEQQNELIELGVILPIGQQLKPLLGQKEITTAFLKKLMRKRGLICSSEEKDDIVTLMLQVVLTPIEIRSILQELKTKEEAFKVRHESLKFTSSDIDLVDIAQTEFLKLNKIGSDPFGNFKIVGSPSFIITDQKGEQKALLSYVLERRHINSDYIQNRRKFRGEIEFSRKLGDSKLDVTSRYSSADTKKINDKGISRVKKKAKKRDLITTEASVRITFGCFDNASRVKFLKECLNCDSHTEVYFDKITDLDLKPDDSLNLKKQEKLAWTADRVSAIRLSGKKLEDTFFITDDECHPFILMWRLEGRFGFTSSRCKGYFKVIFDFSGYARSAKDRCRFDYSITELKLESDYPNQPTVLELKKEFEAHLKQAVDQSYENSRS